jgi:hypothetical protein
MFIKSVDRNTSHSIDKKGKFSRKRLNEDEGDITYINEHNRVFNKKVSKTFSFFVACADGTRLRDTTTSIRLRFGLALSVGLHFDGIN